MFQVTSSLYRELADRLADAIGAKNYFSGTVRCEAGAFGCRLTVTLIIYRAEDALPEGSVSRVVDLVPVWWEFHVDAIDGERNSDFSFRELKTYLV